MCEFAWPRRASILCSALMLATLWGCASTGSALERFDEAESRWVSLGPVVVESMRGSRDGAEVQATAVLTRGQDRLTLTIELHLDPPARFVDGQHDSTIDGRSFQGPVTSDSVDFLGGQSAQSSVGGVYRLEGVGGTRYRVRIPATALSGR